MSGTDDLPAKYIATDDDKDWAKNNARSLDLIVSTVSSPNMPLMDYLTMLDTNGTFCQVGAPEDPIPAFHAFALIGKAVHITGSMIGPPAEIQEMLQLAADKGIKAWTQVRPMKEANEAVVDMEKGHARYRYVLKN